MRTKTLLLSAAIGAAGVTSAMAQPVYSVNIVGYINLAIPSGLSMIANQLDATPDNTLPNVFGAPTGTLSISKFNPAAGNFETSIFDEGFWSNTAMQLNPGEGAFADNPPGQGTLNTTLVGQVRLNSQVQFVPGLRIFSSVIPQAGALTPDLGFPVPPSGQFTVSKYNRTTGGFDSYVYDEDINPAQPWSPSVPTLAIGESAFSDLAPGAPPFSWDRNFVVGQ